MNNIYIIGGLVAVVLVGGYFAFSQSGGNASGEGSKDVPSTFSGTAKDLIALGKNITCTFSQNESGATVEGTVYVAAQGERIRGDFAITSQGESMQASLIRRDGINYTWGETPFGPFASKVNVDEPSSKDNQGVDFDESIDYRCSSWRVDSSKFDLPSGVNFDDINPQVQQINEAMEQVNDIQCSACDNIPDANAQAQCKAALGCS